MSVSTKEDYVKICIEPPPGKTRVPQDIVAVLDISGSMGAEALVKNTDG